MGESPARILLVEDDAHLRGVLATTLGARGYRCTEAATATEALLHASSHAPDVVLLDLGLPDGNGFDVTRRIRTWSAMPIIVLSARGQEQDKVQALDAGADDYLTKPFGVMELLARIRVALRHAARVGDDAACEHAWADDAGNGFRVDLVRRTVRKQSGGVDAEVRLTPIEFRLLAALIRHQGMVVTHTRLLEEVWGPPHAHDVAYLRVFMGQLRHKLEPEPARPRFLRTEPGVGYRLVDTDRD